MLVDALNHVYLVLMRTLFSLVARLNRGEMKRGTVHDLSAGPFDPRLRNLNLARPLV